MQVNNSLSNQVFTAEPGEVPVVRPSGSRGVLPPQVLKRLEETTKRLEKFEVDRKPEPAPSIPSHPNARGLIEPKLTDDQLLKIQSALCVKGDAILGPNTRAAIDDWRSGFPIGDELTEVELEAELAKGLSAPEALYLQDTSSCEKLRFKSAFERAHLHDERTRAGFTKEGVQTEGEDCEKA